MVEIILVQSSSIIYHARAVKILKSLNKKYSVLGIGWNREGLSKKTVNSFFVDLKLFNVKAPFSKKSLVAFFPLFWIWVFVKLIIYRPNIVHAFNLDTVIPSYLYKLLFRKKLVFDVVDRISMSRISPKNVILYSFVNMLEEFYSKRSDVLTSVTAKLLKTFTKKPECCELIMNCSEDYKINTKGSSSGKLILSYAAPVTRTQGLQKISIAIQDLSGVELVCAGRILDNELLNQVLKTEKVTYKGLLLPEDAIALEANSDVIISLYDLSVPNYNVALSVKTFEAMMLGKPVITNIAHELIDEIGCGIEVKWDDPNQIKNAIITLRDNTELRETLGKNGRNAFEKKYNWNNMEKKLYKIYDKILKE